MSVRPANEASAPTADERLATGNLAAAVEEQTRTPGAAGTSQLIHQILTGLPGVDTDNAALKVSTPLSPYSRHRKPWNKWSMQVL